MIRHVEAAAALAAAFFLPPEGSEAQESPFLGVISEVRGGVLAHDLEFLGQGREGGVDLNAEALFVSPGFLEAVLAPRPHLGISVNTAGDTSQLYAGLTWRHVPFGGPVWLAGSVGGTLHDGEITGIVGKAPRDRAELGSRVLFRLAAEIGFDVTRRISVSLVYEHASNANLADENAGLNNAGVRLGWRF